MANGYSQNLRLYDIFASGKLRNVLPYFNYYEDKDEKGKTYISIYAETFNKVLTYGVNLGANRCYLTPKIEKTDNLISVSGQLKKDLTLDNAVDTIYNELLGRVGIMNLTANNGNLIRDALKTDAKSNHSNKLWLKQKTLAEIKALGPKDLEKVLNDIINNLFFSDSYAEVRKKYKIEESFTHYERFQSAWQSLVGDNGE